MAYVYAWSAPLPLRAVPPDSRALVLVCQCPVQVPHGTPAAPPPPPPVQVYIKRGDRYPPVDAAWLDLDDHRVTLTPPGGSPLVLTTAMVAKANHDQTRGALVLLPSASGARMLKDTEWKG